uniref:Kazal-like domain-containing protein n=1 Tax=Microcebus murinus TaxID=30608 RepID=A0A8C5XTD6_MICMU
MALAARRLARLLLAQVFAGNRRSPAGRRDPRGRRRGRGRRASPPGRLGHVPATRYWRFPPNCGQYKLPECPRDYNPVCGSDMSTYPNGMYLCAMEDGHDIKIIREEPC